MVKHVYVHWLIQERWYRRFKDLSLLSKPWQHPLHLPIKTSLAGLMSRSFWSESCFHNQKRLIFRHSKVFVRMKNSLIWFENWKNFKICLVSGVPCCQNNDESMILGVFNGNPVVKTQTNEGPCSILAEAKIHVLYISLEKKFMTLNRHSDPGWW